MTRIESSISIFILSDEFADGKDRIETLPIRVVSANSGFAVGSMGRCQTLYSRPFSDPKNLGLLMHGDFSSLYRVSVWNLVWSR